MINEIYVKELDGLKLKGLLRRLRINKPNKSHRIFIDGKEYINFSSNDYLGLSRNPRVIAAAVRAGEIYGTGAASSRLLSGTFKIHDEIENELAKFKKAESALVFPSGYQTNLSVISALVSEGDCVIMDRLCHASIIDGARLSKAKLLVYRHKDTEDLERILKTSRGNRKLIITDGVFSMDGDIAPLDRISDLAKKYSALLLVDEAHSTGIFGKNGSGLAEHFGIDERIDIKMGTLSKAIGSQGGFVCVSSVMRNYIINKARGFMFTTALSPMCAAAALESLKVIQESSSSRENLLTNAGYLRKRLKSAGYDTLSSESQIVPVLVGDTAKTLKLSEYLFDRGIYVPPIRYPTVPKDAARLRISLTVEHTVDDIDRFCDILEKYHKS